MSEPFGAMPTRWDPASGPSSKVALVLPGSGYSPAHPLLEFGRQALIEHGWTVQQIWWDGPGEQADLTEVTTWVCEQARTALDAEAAADRLLVLAKSLGTLAAPVVAQRGCDAIWLTPLFSAAACIEAIETAATNGARQLVVGGSSDPEWDSTCASRLDSRARRIDVVEIAGATHFLHVPQDAVGSVEIQLKVSLAVDAFLTRIGD